MLDWTKPIQTRDGRPARILATNVPFEALRRATGRYTQVDDSMLVEVGSEALAYKPDGRYFRRTESAYDLVNVPSEPVRTSEFRLFQPAPRANRNSLGNFRATSKDDLLPQLDYLDNMNRPVWVGIIEIIREGDDVVDVKFHPKEPSE